MLSLSARFQGRRRASGRLTMDITCCARSPDDIEAVMLVAPSREGPGMASNRRPGDLDTELRPAGRESQMVSAPATWQPAHPRHGLGTPARAPLADAQRTAGRRHL